MAQCRSTITLVGVALALTAGKLSLGFLAPRPSPQVPPAGDVMLRGSATTSLPHAQSGSRTASATTMALLGFVGGAVLLAASKRSQRTSTEAVGLFFSTQTGNTETCAGYIAEQTGLEAADIGEYSAEDLVEYDGLIVGCPTWNTGADEYRSGTAWDDLLDDIKGVDLSGKKVAIFGCGDSEGYGDNYCDGIEELHETFKAAGANLIGYVSTDSYSHSESKSEANGKFLGCAFDEDNQSDLSQGRAEAWVAQIKSEGMPL